MLTVIRTGVSRISESELDGGVRWWVISGVKNMVVIEEGQPLDVTIVEQLYEKSGGIVPFAAWYGGVGRPFREAPYCKVYGNKAIIKQRFGWDC